ncbi:hypothetical protein LSM04_001780 [Trypanosoma melophagium]|uniref:uncharacterized protein n=1 Tax=Trypanosoma melophagium TaxID=715481 RepID=UPI00351A9CD5|nr:hypothetical protein LSM04_001780 [Trypanosoma melophagium]
MTVMYSGFESSLSQVSSCKAMLIPPVHSLSEVEWTTSVKAFSTYLLHNGPTIFSFCFRPAHVPHLIYHVDGILTRLNGKLIIYLDGNHRTNFSSLCDSLVCFAMPMDLKFLNAFEDPLSSLFLEYLLETSPAQLLTAYRLVFPIPSTARSDYDEAWNNFVSWASAVTEGRPPSNYVNLGRRLYTELRKTQSLHDISGVCIQDLQKVIVKPLKEEEPLPQLLQKEETLNLPPRNTEWYGRQNKNNHHHNSDQGKNIQTLRYDYVLGEKRGSRSRSRGNVRSKSRSRFVNTIGKIRGYNRTPSRHDTLSGTLARNRRQVRALGNVDIEELQKWTTLPWAQPESRKDGISTFFQGHDLLQRTHCTPLASQEEEDRFPLQQIDVNSLSLKWIRRRLKPEAREHFNKVWNIMRRPPAFNDQKGEPHLCIKQKDAVLMKTAGVIREASEHPTRGWVIPFTVVENQPSGQRIRFIAWPKAKNDQEDYDVDVPLCYISEYLSAVYDESATSINLKASSFQVALPADIQANFRCRTEPGELVQFTPPPMGYKCGLEIIHTITRVLAEDSEIVKPQFAAPKELKVHIWIDSTRISGLREIVSRWTKQIFQKLQQCGATVEEKELITKKYEFMEVLFNHETQTISVGQNLIVKLKETPSLRTSTLEDMEDTVSRIMYASGVRGESLFPYYYFFFLKLVRQRLSSLNHGDLSLRDPSNLPLHALKVGEEWLKHLLENKPVYPPKNLPTSATLVTDASMHGWGALLFKDTGEVLATGGKWEKAPHLISQGEARAVHLALRTFEAHLVDSLHICVDNTTVLNIMKKGNTHSGCFGA